jgi:hypothetical protein
MGNGSRIFHGDVFKGTYVIYGVEEGGAYAFTADFKAETLKHSDVGMLRATRLLQRKKLRKPLRLPKSALINEAMIVFGPEVDPTRAVLLLQKAIAKIKHDGLMIGSESSMGELKLEPYKRPRSRPLKRARRYWKI